MHSVRWCLVSFTSTVSLPSSLRLIGEGKGKGKGKVKIYPRTGYEVPEGAKWGGCLTPHPGGFTPENDRATHCKGGLVGYRAGLDG